MVIKRKHKNYIIVNKNIKLVFKITKKHIPNTIIVKFGILNNNFKGIKYIFFYQEEFIKLINKLTSFPISIKYSFEELFFIDPTIELKLSSIDNKKWLDISFNYDNSASKQTIVLDNEEINNFLKLIKYNII